MGTKVASVQLYMNDETATHFRLSSYREVVVNEWVPAIASLSEDGCLNLSADLNGIKGHLLIKPIQLNTDWSFFTDVLIPDKSIVPELPKYSQPMQLFCLRHCKGAFIWFLFGTRRERDIWTEAILKSVSSSICSTEPPSPYDDYEYDNWPIYSKDAAYISSLSGYTSVVPPVTKQPQASELVKVDSRFPERVSVPIKGKTTSGVCSCCWATDSGSSEGLDTEAKSSSSGQQYSHTPLQQSQTDGCCTQCCTLFCGSLLFGCTAV